MIQIYTSYEKVMKLGIPFISSNDKWFEEHEDSTIKNSMDAVDIGLIERLDSGIYNGYSVKTESEEIQIYDLSIGCKTAININHLIKSKQTAIVDITQCEEDVIQEIFKIVDNTGIILMLDHCDILGIEQRYTFNLNGTKNVDSVRDIIIYMLDELSYEKVIHGENNET